VLKSGPSQAVPATPGSLVLQWIIQDDRFDTDSVTIFPSALTLPTPRFSA